VSITYAQVWILTIGKTKKLGGSLIRLKAEDRLKAEG
jgi:hypothetical protein